MIYSVQVDYNKILYCVCLLVFFSLAFMILKATNFDKLFKQGKTTEIKIGYFVVCLIIAHILSSILINILV